MNLRIWLFVLWKNLLPYAGEFRRGKALPAASAEIFSKWNGTAQAFSLCYQKNTGT
jgi:hypothetical protein